MKVFKSVILIAFLFTGLSVAQSADINIIPKPVSVVSREGVFVIDANTTIVVEHRDDRQLADLLSARLRSDHGIGVRTSSKKKGAPAIYISRTGDYQVAGNGYAIVSDAKQVNLEAATAAGRFYAVQSLLQMIRREGDKVSIPSANVTDLPRFPYRGMHLDIARHFQPVEFVKKYIDQMAQLKLNYFHWHLTDDQGWRIEIKKYPKLTEVGSKRPETVKERNLSPYIGDGVPHGGFYTQDQIKEVVAYAKERYITVVPEIELPGHASAALEAYPQLGCKADYKYKVQTTWGIFKETFCPTDETFKFLEDVLDETIKLFPDSPYIHIGGDEVLKDHWKESAFVQELKKKHNLKDEHEVQSYFVQRIEKFINSKGKKIIGWDEILEGGLAPNATVMSWRGMKGGIEAAKSKHDVIMTPTDFVYLDYGQGDPAYEPLNIGSYVPLEKVYSFEPVPPELTPDEAKYIIGAQANLWTEYIKTPSHVEYMAFPRMLALAEVAWSRKEDKNYADFHRRMLATLPRLEKQGVSFRIPEPMPTGAFLVPEGGTYTVDIKPPFPGAKVRYTTDGRNPTEDSPEAPAKFVADPEDDKVLQLKTIVVLPSGRKSVPYAAVFMRRTMREPDVTNAAVPGVNYSLAVPPTDGAGTPSEQKGEARSILLNQFGQRIDLKKPFGVQFDGYFRAPQDGVYEFQIESTWDATFVIGENGKLIDEAGTAESKKYTVIVPLKAGLHKMSLRYNHRGGDSNFRFRWGIKGQGLRQAYGGEFVH